MNGVELWRRQSFEEALVAVAEPLARTRVGAATLRAGIRYEAFLRRQQRRSEGLASLTTGFSTQQQRWARAERSDRARLAPARNDRQRRSSVFWHGPDHAARRGPAIVLINGWTASGLVWPGRVVSELERSHDVVRIDNRGSGYSRTVPSPFTMATMADDVAAVVRTIGAESVVLVGLSMGGMIAQETALRHPALVDRLVLCGTRPPAPVGFWTDAGVRAMMVPPARGESTEDYLARSWRAVAGPAFEERDPDAFRELVQLVAARPTPRSATMDQLRAISSWHAPGRLADISAPTTVIHGAEDPLIPVGNGMRLAQVIPSVRRYVELPDVGHVVPFEAPDVLIREVLSDDE